MTLPKLKTKIKRFVTDRLSRDGFELSNSRIPQRILGSLRQGIEFQPVRGEHDSLYLLNAHWGFRHSLDQGFHFDGVKQYWNMRLQNQSGFSYTNDRLDVDFLEVETVILNEILPRLERYATIEKIIGDIELNVLTLEEALGSDIGWQHFNLGFCYRTLGNRTLSDFHFNELIAHHSQYEMDWVQARRLAALEYLKR